MFIIHVCTLNILKTKKYEVSFNSDRDVENKINKFRWICETINRTLKNKVRKDTKLKLYKTMAVPTLL